MKNKLASKIFRDFFNDIERIELKMKDLAELITEKIPAIAEEVAIGRLICHFFAPPMFTEEDNQNVSIEFYASKEGHGAEALSYEYLTAEGGKVCFSVYPLPDHVWDQEDKEEIQFLCRNLYIICGRAKLLAVIKNSVTRDGYTGLPNAGGFIRMGSRLKAEGKLCNYTAMYVNLKNFKCINSQFGNKSGDKVIREYADIVRQLVNKDEMVARLGGDNFTLLIKKERRDEILGFLSDVKITLHSELGDRVISVPSRVGVYDIKEKDHMPVVMNYISAAISSAKHSPTKNVIEFNQEIMQRLTSQQQVTAGFPDAIKNREFIVYYQPKVDLKTNEMCGCEALVRWNKDGRIIPPGEFISVLEQDGSICTLDFYMLDSVCQDIKRWKEQGLEPVTVSVNFSKIHLHNPNIAEDILGIINKYEIENRYIEIELTEMSDYNDYDAFKKLVTKMKDSGVMTSIDDFGTGYSSLNLLTDFMFDIVKLDKSFIDNIIKNNSATDEIVVRNIVKMLKELDMKAIAEGVETTEQARFLKDIDCNVVQGFLYDKPLPPEEFEKRLAARKYNHSI